MKKVVFANVEFTLDFTSKEEAIKYVRDNQGKGWFFEPISPDENGYDKFVYKQRDEDSWTVIVRKPYKNYYAGW